MRQLRAVLQKGRTTEEADDVEQENKMLKAMINTEKADEKANFIESKSFQRS